LYTAHLPVLTIEGEVHKLLSPEANKDLKILQDENKHLKEQHSAVSKKLVKMSQDFQEALENVEQRVLERMYSAGKLPGEFYQP
jgi:predicted  nucleic acid-binding Zn-ribbon protein